MTTTIPQKLKDKLKRPHASDRDILQFFDYFFSQIPPTQKQTPPSSSGCWVIQGHGDDLEIHQRVLIIHDIALSYPELSEHMPKIAAYMNTNVFLTVAMGLPGPSAPMEGPEEDGRWVGLTTSEIDVQIVRNIFELFNTSQTLCNSSLACLDSLNFIIRQQLRANFYKIWESSPRGSSWTHWFKKLMDMGEIWVQKSFDSETTVNREYFLRPNVGENPEFRVHEGIHMIDMRDANGNLIRDLIVSSERNFDANNLEFPECKNRLDRYFHSLYPGLSRGAPYEIAFNKIMEKINSRDEPYVMVSDIILLGYLLKINYLQLYDPTCRPLTDETRMAYTKSGTQFRDDEITGNLAYKRETLKRKYSFSGGKTRRKQKKIKKTNKKLKKKRKSFSNK
jgi:hypothetical protein